MGKESKKTSGTIAVALAVIVLGVALGIGLARYGSALPVLGPLFGEVQPNTTTSPVVVEGIQKLDQLATVRWTESVVVTKKIGGGDLKRFLTGEKLVLVATGQVEAGVDLSSLSKDDVKVQDNRVQIQLPDPEILSSSLDESKTRLYDRDQGLLRLRPDDTLVETARDDAQQEILAAARNNGILDTAERNAEDSIRAFVTTLGFEEVRFE